MNEDRFVKRVDFIGSSREDLKGFPEDVKQNIGYALFEAQRGQKAGCAKPMKGFGGAGVLEIIENFSGGTYRAVYTVRFQKIVYVLHCFQKKSKHGIKTPQEDIDVIKQRMKISEDDYKINYKDGD